MEEASSSFSLNKRRKYNETDSSGDHGRNKDETEQVEEDEFDEKDLPLLANVEEIRVIHQLMKLSFDFESRVVDGIIILFLDPTCNTSQSLTKIVLDCCSILCKSVYLLKTQDEFSSQQCLARRVAGMKDFYKQDNLDWFSLSGEELTFSVQKWSLTININEKSQIVRPSVIRINYETSPYTPSLHWRPSTGWKYSEAPTRCVYTPACPVNNRGLFPCQEPPSAMSSWECLTVCKVNYVPLLTSDEPGEKISSVDDTSVFYFYSSMILPMSTFAITIGEYNMVLNYTESLSIITNPRLPQETICKHEEYPCRIKNRQTENSEDISVRVFSLQGAPVSFVHDSLKQCLSLSLQGISKSLGVFPFDRVDFVILPKYFPHLGLCSPNLIFLSPSLFEGESPLYLFRLPHEITHYWFGLLVGAKDWLDEYLCEGFATFMEDILHVEMYRDTKEKSKLLEEIDLRSCLRLITLQNEISHVEPNLQVLNPEPGPIAQVLQGGLEPIKPYTQMHYLKGYFFLKRLMMFVGQDEFVIFLKKYVLEFHGQLVTSDMFIDFYFDTFRESLINHSDFESIEKLKELWLKMDGLPAPFKSINILDFESQLSVLNAFPNVRKPLEEIKNVYEMIISPRFSSDVLREALKSLSSCQMIMLLEKLLMICNSVENSVQIYNRFMECAVVQLDNFNPEITHRICELIVMQKDTKKSKIIQDFLENHQSLGVYLYGELMISEKRIFQKLAKKLYSQQVDVLSTDQQKLLHEMIH